MSRRSGVKWPRRKPSEMVGVIGDGVVGHLVVVVPAELQSGHRGHIANWFDDGTRWRCSCGWTEAAP